MYDEFEANQSVAVEAVDIVTAYKSLKLAMNKNIKGLATEANDNINMKNYLKPTLASRQAQRMPVRTGYAGLPASANALLPEINRGSIRTAPMGTTRPKMGEYDKPVGLNNRGIAYYCQDGLTLQDYANGTAWGQEKTENERRTAATSNAGAMTSDGQRRRGTAPSWRKSREQKVNEKVAKL